MPWTCSSDVKTDITTQILIVPVFYVPKQLVVGQFKGENYICKKLTLNRFFVHLFSGMRKIGRERIVLGVKIFKKKAVWSINYVKSGG